MKKTLPVFVFAILFLSLSSPARALDILILPNGSVAFYAGQVLGDEDGNEQKEEEKTRERHEERKEEEQRLEKPERVVPSTAAKQIRLRENERTTEVILEKRQKTKSHAFETQEVMRTDAVRMEVPAAIREREEEQEQEREDATPERRETERERSSRREEKIQIETKVEDDGRTEMQFQSRSVQATVKNAEIVVDPQTNVVSVVTPSGKTVELVHLPDQAKERMIAAGVIGEQSPQAALEVETNDEGETVYGLEEERTGRFLNVIPVKQRVRIELNDQTGEISESVVSPNAVARFFSQFVQ